MVRARKKEHLLQINQEALIEQVTPSDYPWRTTLTRAEFKIALIAQIDQVDYDNFKNAVPDHQYHTFLSRVWTEGYGYGQLVNRRSNIDNHECFTDDRYHDPRVGENGFFPAGDEDDEWEQELAERMKREQE
jgi:hypothetical protein